MKRKKKIQVVIIITALFLCGILYLVMGPGAGRAESDDEGTFIAGGTRDGSDGESGVTRTGDGNSESGSGSVFNDNTDGSKDVSENDDGGDASGKGFTDVPGGIGGDVYIYICGAVKKPGVYTFDHVPRIVEVVEQAGGFTKKADQTSVNLAGQLEDGAQIVVYERNRDGTPAIDLPQTGDTTFDNGASGSFGVSSGDSRVNINTAGLEELKTIPGIGDVKAAAIVSFRDENGRFGKIEDLMNISGIKQGTFDKIKDYVTV
ncbi:MAG: helix-hairpin-helix domain-containing protein [Eubacterium sp.]|nr:helix-hairpin-helix domain-containing protein [Eubacterium sp.]